MSYSADTYGLVHFNYAGGEFTGKFKVLPMVMRCFSMITLRILKLRNLRYTGPKAQQFT